MLVGGFPASKLGSMFKYIGCPLRLLSAVVALARSCKYHKYCCCFFSLLVCLRFCHPSFDRVFSVSGAVCVTAPLMVSAARSVSCLVLLLCSHQAACTTSIFVLFVCFVGLSSFFAIRRLIVFSSFRGRCVATLGVSAVSSVFSVLFLKLIKSMASFFLFHVFGRQVTQKDLPGADIQYYVQVVFFFSSPVTKRVPVNTKR